jgi:hypothetical protein
MRGLRPAHPSFFEKTLANTAQRLGDVSDDSAPKALNMEAPAHIPALADEVIE